MKIFTKEEIATFAILTLQKQLDVGFIDEEHLPEKNRLRLNTIIEESLTKKIEELNTIPHEQDVLEATKNLYNDQESFNEYFAALIKRLTDDTTLSDLIH